MPKWLTVVIVAVLAIALVGGGAAFAAYRVGRAEAPRAAWSGGWPTGRLGFAGPMMSGRGSGFAGPMMGGYSTGFAGPMMGGYSRGFAGPMMGGYGGGFAGPMMGGYGGGFAGPMMGGYGGVFAGGAMHEYVFPALAEALDLSVEDLGARLQDGESIADIAESQGLSLDELADAQKAAIEQALQAAVESGELTQEQADWILDHHAAGRFVLGAGPMGFIGGRGFMHGWSGPRVWGEFGEVPAP